MTALAHQQPRAAERDRGRLVVRGLSVRFRLRTGAVAAVRDVDLDLQAGECLALVGESGCGKSVLAAALLGLLPGNAETAGTAHLHSPGSDPVELLGATEKTLARQVRGRQVALVPQSPASHLTPVRTAGDQLREALRTLRPGVRDVDAAAVATAERVGLPAAALGLYPHELSGGMAQRVATALALAGEQAWLVLADEPTTGLDRPLVERTLDALRDLVDDRRAVLLITHDLAGAARTADRLAVMYAGRIVETGPVDDVLSAPRHPYTAGLLGALPERGFRPIPGLPPELSALPAGCAFAPRCARADADCRVLPELDAGTPSAACHHPC